MRPVSANSAPYAVEYPELLCKRSCRQRRAFLQLFNGKVHPEALFLVFANSFICSYGDTLQFFCFEFRNVGGQNVATPEDFHFPLERFGRVS